jgi:hypothetical protein
MGLFGWTSVTSGSTVYGTQVQHMDSWITNKLQSTIDKD